MVSQSEIKISNIKEMIFEMSINVLYNANYVIKISEKERIIGTWENDKIMKKSTLKKIKDEELDRTKECG